MQRYVNQRVEIQGVFQNENTAGAMTGTQRALRITSVKPLGGTCDR